MMKVGKSRLLLTDNKDNKILIPLIIRSRKSNNFSTAKISCNGLFDKKVEEHIQTILLPQIQSILFYLNKSYYSFKIIIGDYRESNPTRSKYLISDYSYDLAVYITMLSSALSIPIDQSILLTGCINSVEGEISIYDNLLRNLKAACSDETITTLIYPSINNDISLINFNPDKFENVNATIRNCRRKIKLIAVCNTFDLIRNTLQIQDIVVSSLLKKYYELEEFPSPKNITEFIINYLVQNNKKRFWNVLKRNLQFKNVEKAHTLVKLYAKYFLNKKKYPSNFGIKLNDIVQSLPFSSRKEYALFPLIEKDLWLSLVKYSKEDDYEDMALFQKINSDTENGTETKVAQNKDEQSFDDADDILSYLMSKIDSDYIDINITQKLDEARGSYVIEKNSCLDNEKFIDEIQSYYRHILTKIYAREQPILEEQLGIESIDILKQTFPEDYELKETTLRGLKGIDGGLRKILDSICEYIKKDHKEKYIRGVIYSTISPLDYSLKKNLIEAIMNRERENLDPDLRDLNPEQYVENYIEILTSYAMAKKSINRLFRIY